MEQWTVSKLGNEYIKAVYCHPAYLTSMQSWTSLVAQTVKRLQCGRPGFDPWVGKIPWRRKRQPTPVLLPRKTHGQRSLRSMGLQRVGHDWATSLTMQSTSCEMLGWMKHKLESRLQGEISITSDMQMTPPLMAESKEELKSLVMKVKEESEKNRLEAQHSENEDHSIWSHHFMGNRWGNSENSVRLFFGGFQNHCRWWLQPWN